MMMVALQLAVDREAPGEGHEWRHQLLLVRPLHHAATTTKMKKTISFWIPIHYWKHKIQIFMLNLVLKLTSGIWIHTNGA